MSKTFTGLDTVFDVEPIETKAVQVIDTIRVKEDVEDDLEFTRQNLKRMITKGHEALDTAFDIARASEAPRAFEVASQMINTLSNANKDLLELRKKAKDVSDTKLQLPTTVNNTLFVGSTAELLKMLRNKPDEKV